jgi:nitric oxide reductase NorD protein
VRQRLELFVEAAVRVQVPIRTASAPPPRSLLSRWFEQGKRDRGRVAVPATDGVAVHLPPRLQDDGVVPATEAYRIAALQQAGRIVRASPCAFPWSAPLVVQDLFLIAEAAAIESELARQLPGLAQGFARMRRAVRAARSAGEHHGEAALHAIEGIYREFLDTGRLPAGYQPGTPADSEAWARSFASTLPPATSYRGMVPDLLLGAMLEPDAAMQASAAAGDPQAAGQRTLRTTRLTRRPRARRAAEDEDDQDAGLWMIQTSQPHEHAEDAMGLQRPVDKEPDADLQGAGESIAELESLRLVSTPGSPREAFVGDEPVSMQRVHVAAGSERRAGAFAYPEWNHERQGYVERAALVRVVPSVPGDAAWVDKVLARQHATLARVRRRFEALRSRRAVYHAQREGEDIDLAAFVNAYGDRRARLPRDERLYLASRPARRDFALLVLVDVSGSTEAWCGGTRRIIDLEKEALVVVATALQALRVRFAIQAFSGYGPCDVRVAELKRFAESFDRSLAQRIAALEPDEFTRLGAALRHAAATVGREPAHRRLLLLLSDGKPNDCDRYEGRYGFEDARQALAEARLQGIAPFCVTVDHQASHHLASLFGPGNYAVVNAPERLTAALLEWLRAVTLALA